MKVWIAIDPDYQNEVILFREEPVFDEDEKSWYSPTECEFTITSMKTLKKILGYIIRDTKKAYLVEVPYDWWERKTKFN